MLTEVPMSTSPGCSCGPDSPIEVKLSQLVVLSNPLCTLTNASSRTMKSAGMEKPTAIVVIGALHR